MDVRSPDDAQELVRVGRNAFGRVDTLVANAGIGMYGGILDHTDEELATMLDTNVGGTIWPIRAAVPHFVGQGRGDIVIVASRGVSRRCRRGGLCRHEVRPGRSGRSAGSGAPRARDPGDDDRTGGHLDRVRNGRRPYEGHAGARDLPQVRRTSRLRSGRSSSSRAASGPSTGRSGAWPRAPDPGHAKARAGHAAPGRRRADRARGPAGDQAVACWGTLPCWRIRIGLPNGSRSPCRCRRSGRWAPG